MNSNGIKLKNKFIDTQPAQQNATDTGGNLLAGKSLHFHRIRMSRLICAGDGLRCWQWSLEFAFAFRADAGRARL